MGAFTAPKYTMLPEAVGLKLAPEIVTISPTLADKGEKEWITGWADQKQELNSFLYKNVYI